MKILIIIGFSLCLMMAGSRSSSGVTVLSGEDVLVLSAPKVKTELKRRTDFTKKKANDNALQKRRHKRRRKVRPPKQGK